MKCFYKLFFNQFKKKNVYLTRENQNNENTRDEIMKIHSATTLY